MRLDSGDKHSKNDTKQAHESEWAGEEDLEDEEGDCIANTEDKSLHARHVVLLWKQIRCCQH
eukprot:scaffold111551_cov18-Tisochrysis_lutea.AAC.1